MPICRLRAETTRPTAEQSAITTAPGLKTIAVQAESPSSPESALIVVSEAAQKRPAETPSITPSRGLRIAATATAIAAALTIAT